MDPHQLLDALRETSLFRQWKQAHPKAECSHFFARVNPQYEVAGVWDIGFYNPADGKITVFTEKKKAEESAGGRNGAERDFEEKPADEVFKAPADTVEVLLLPLVKTNSDDILSRCREILPQCFPGQNIGDGFLILQTFQGKTIWNVSYIAAQLEFLNLKFDAQSGEKVSQDVVSLRG